MAHTFADLLTHLHGSLLKRHGVRYRERYIWERILTPLRGWVGWWWPPFPRLAPWAKFFRPLSSLVAQTVPPVITNH